MRFAAAFAVLAAALAVPAHGHTVSVTTTIEEWVEVGAERLFSSHSAAPVAGPAYGPFRVLGTSRAALVDATDASSPSAFESMLRDHPGIEVIEMIECPGTDDDVANLKLGRMI